jgi:hypothetical protein
MDKASRGKVQQCRRSLLDRPRFCRAGPLGIKRNIISFFVDTHLEIRYPMTAEAAANEASPPPEMAKHARIAYLASRTTFVLSFPRLFSMGAASHYSFF